MKHRLVFVALAAMAFALNGSGALANDEAAEDAATVKAPKAAKPSSRRAEIAARRAEMAKIKPIDINSAKAAELMKLPGIGKAEADKIIAGRPYASKDWLVEKNIISVNVYYTIERQIIARQPFKDGAKNAALYANKK